MLRPVRTELTGGVGRLERRHRQLLEKAQNEYLVSRSHAPEVLAMLCSWDQLTCILHLCLFSGGHHCPRPYHPLLGLVQLGTAIVHKDRHGSAEDAGDARVNSTSSDLDFLLEVV